MSPTLLALTKLWLAIYLLLSVFDIISELSMMDFLTLSTSCGLIVHEMEGSFLCLMTGDFFSEDLAAGHI